MVLAADNRKREFQEEKGNEFEDFDEEEEDDGKRMMNLCIYEVERSRRSRSKNAFTLPEESETTTQNTEQWGELSYEGTDPPQDNDGHAAWAGPRWGRSLKFELTAYWEENTNTLKKRKKQKIKRDLWFDLILFLTSVSLIYSYHHVPWSFV